MSPKTHQFIKTIRDVVILLIVFMAVSFYMQRNVVDGPAPLIEGTLLNNEPISLVQFRGKPALIHFWATWCGICRFEQNGINNIANDQQVITIAMSSGDQLVMQNYMQENALSFPVLNDPYAELSGIYGVQGVPASFIIDAQGLIRFTEIGYTSEWGLRLRLWLASFY